MHQQVYSIPANLVILSLSTGRSSVTDAQAITAIHQFGSQPCLACLFWPKELAGVAGKSCLKELADCEIRFSTIFYSNNETRVTVQIREKEGGLKWRVCWIRLGRASFSITMMIFTLRSRVNNQTKKRLKAFATSRRILQDSAPDKKHQAELFLVERSPDSKMLLLNRSSPLDQKVAASLATNRPRIGHLKHSNHQEAKF